MDKKKIELLASIFVAVIFLTSYAAFGSNGSNTTTTTVSSNPGQTFYAVGNVTGAITGYGPALSLTMKCNASAMSNESAMLNDLLANLEANNSISNYYSPTQSQFMIETGNLNSSGAYRYIYPKLTQTEQGCTTFSSQAVLQLAPLAHFTAQGQKIAVPLTGARQYGMRLNLTQNMQQSYNLRIAALLTINGTIYGNVTVLGIK